MFRFCFVAFPLFLGFGVQGFKAELVQWQVPKWVLHEWESFFGQHFERAAGRQRGLSVYSRQLTECGCRKMMFLKAQDQAQVGHPIGWGLQEALRARAEVPIRDHFFVPFSWWLEKKTLCKTSWDKKKSSFFPSFSQCFGTTRVVQFGRPQVLQRPNQADPGLEGQSRCIYQVASWAFSKPSDLEVGSRSFRYPIIEIFIVMRWVGFKFTWIILNSSWR